MTKPVFVIVGASLAGAKAAAELRAGGFDGQVILISAETEHPYERPPLTKDYLRGETEREKAYVHADDFYARHEIELMTGVTVTAIEPGRSRVTLDSGRTLGYDKLLLTPGAQPRRLDVPGAGLDGIYYLRTLADCDLLRERLEAGGRVAVAGAGWIGSEFAASAPDIFAAGDVANAWHPFYQRPVRLEHWANALHQGPAAAQAMLGRPVSYDRIPYFFSDQYDAGMEYSGFAPEWDEVVFRGDRAGGEFIAFWLRDARVVAGMNVNVWDVNDHIQALIRSRQPVTVAALADPDTPLDLLASDPVGRA
jgi:NADPH-dependent 2,4-dienoyl-CoA reductase/sulfur reductase-like enzyme